MSKLDSSGKKRTWKCEIVAVVTPGCACRHLVNKRRLYKLRVRGPPLGLAGLCRHCVVVEIQDQM